MHAISFLCLCMQSKRTRLTHWQIERCRNVCVPGRKPSLHAPSLGLQEGKWGEQDKNRWQHREKTSFFLFSFSSRFRLMKGEEEKKKRRQPQAKSREIYMWRRKERLFYPTASNSFSLVYIHQVSSFPSLSFIHFSSYTSLWIVSIEKRLQKIRRQSFFLSSCSIFWEEDRGEVFY